MSARRDIDRDLRTTLFTARDDEMTVCPMCLGSGVRCHGQNDSRLYAMCDTCEGRAWVGGDGSQPSPYLPGDGRKVALMQDRYVRGLPLWNPDDVVGIAEDQPWRDEQVAAVIDEESGEDGEDSDTLYGDGEDDDNDNEFR